MKVKFLNWFAGTYLGDKIASFGKKLYEIQMRKILIEIWGDKVIADAESNSRRD